MSNRPRPFMRRLLDFDTHSIRRTIVCLCMVGMVALPAAGQHMLQPLPLNDLSSFQPTGATWRVVGGVYADRSQALHLQTQPGTGILVAVPTDDGAEHLFTVWEHGDLTLELDVMMPAGSNSGIYLQGRYEVQLFDSWGVRNPTYSDMGGISQRWDEALPDGREGLGGVRPSMNAARAPGLWQRLEIDFRAPRFDARGNKTENARFERVVLNGVTVQENVSVAGPTRAAPFDDEAATGPLMIQGDHGPVALSNIRYKRYRPERVRLTDLTYDVFEGDFARLPDVNELDPTQSGTLDGFRHDVVGSLQSFAARFEGVLTVPTSGLHRFELDLEWVDEDPHFEENPSGGAALRIGDTVTLEHLGQAPTAANTVYLDAAEHPFELTYFKNVSWLGSEALLFVEGPDTRRRLLNIEAAEPPPQHANPIRVSAAGAPTLLRHMVEDDSTRRTHALSVGDPSGVHYTVDLSGGALLRVWRGSFLDATPMWDGRGYNQLGLPLGSSLSLNSGTVGPIEHDRYTIDEAGLPTFFYSADRSTVVDRIRPAMDGRALRRTVTATGEVRLRLTESERIERLPDESYAVNDRAYVIHVEDGPEPRPDSTGRGLFVDISDDSFTYTIIW